MWQKYCEFLINTARAPVDEARAALEGAVAACANEPAAGPLWDMYIQLETIQNDMFRLNQVFKRVLQQPLSNLEEFWDKYNHFVLAQQLNVLATPEELAAMGAEEEMDEGLLRVKIVNAVEAIKNKTAEAISKRQSFEARIDRNYFHVTPVTADALSNWHSYLDYEEIVGDKARCGLLYERCLISCANYEQMWVRYAHWRERVDGFDAANAVFQRAVTVFLKRRASVYLEYASFLEANGKFAEARAMYMKVLNELAPQLGEAYVRYANFERRQGKNDVARTWFERALEQLEAQPAVFGYLAVSYATFTHRYIGDVAAARAIYERTTSKVTGSIVLWLSYIHFEIGVGGTDMVNRVEITDLSNDEKNDLWLQYGEFMETYTDNIARVRAVAEKEVTWRRKNGFSRERALKILSIERGAPGSNDGEVGSKRARQEEASNGNSTATASASASAYAQYYQHPQAYTTQGYTAAQPTSAVVAPTATASAGYDQYQQYAAYYQQQQQQQQ
ncbi:hypothetical protein PINS_up007374 [Pythium insidiosum]|nr:hypothetical protein PINS_up007374 [Pythium insidiosum]